MQPNPPPPSYPQPGAQSPQMYINTPGTAKRGNGFATASLVCSLLICIPIVAQLLAIVFGIVGLIKSSGGRGGIVRSIFGIVISCIFLLGVTVVGVAGYGFWKAIEPGYNAATAMITSAKDGDRATLRALCSPDVSDEQIDKLLADIQSRGGIVELVVIPGFNDGKGTTPTPQPPSFLMPAMIVVKFNNQTSMPLQVDVVITPPNAAKVVNFNWVE